MEQMLADRLPNMKERAYKTCTAENIEITLHRIDKSIENLEHCIRMTPDIRRELYHLEYQTKYSARMEQDIANYFFPKTAKNNKKIPIYVPDGVIRSE
jgi:hypothetical protein